MAGYAKTIADDLIAQLEALNAASPLAVADFTASYDRMYLSDLESMQPAGDPASQMQIVIAPVGTEYQRTAYGAVRPIVTLGILFQIAVATADGQVTDSNIDAYEELVDQVCVFLLGPRQFASVWNAKDPTPIYGDHYNAHLYEKSEFHVPVLVDFFCDVGAT